LQFSQQTLFLAFSLAKLLPELMLRGSPLPSYILNDKEIFRLCLFFF